MPKVKAKIGSEVKLCLKLCHSNNSKTTIANVMKLHRKIQHNEKVYHAQVLGPMPKVKATIGLMSNCGYSSVSAITRKLLKEIRWNFTEK